VNPPLTGFEHVGRTTHKGNGPRYAGALSAGQMEVVRSTFAVRKGRLSCGREGFELWGLGFRVRAEVGLGIEVLLVLCGEKCGRRVRTKTV